MSITKEAIDNTAFSTRYRNYEYTKLPFVLANFPAAFRSIMKDVLIEYTDDFVVVCVDDILIYR